MRISDWSSDVCSSDLPCAVCFLRHGGRNLHHRGAADGGADECAGRHAPLGRAGRWRRGHHLLMYFFTAGNNPIAGKAAVGVILVLVILFMPNGILGFVLKRTAGKRSVPPALAAQAAAATEAAPAPATSGKVLLDVPNLSKAFKGVQALDGVSQIGRAHV